MKDIKAVFDIGNDLLKGVVFANENEKDVVLVKQIEATKGIRKGKILDNEEFARTLNKMVEGFIKKLGWDFIDEVFVGVSHPDIKIERVTEQKRIMWSEIQTEDINHLSKVIAEISNHNNYETIKIIPVHRVIDGQKKEKDPLGLQGDKLELVADVFMLPKNFYNGLIEAFDKVGLSIMDIIPNIIWASEIALDYDHRDLGSVLIDIGKNQTSYVIYEDGYPLWYGTIPIGGEDVTKDISIGMQIDIKEWEQIKKSKWTAILDKSDIDENSPIDQHFLTDIINARYEEIFLKINAHLEKLDKDRRLPWGVLLLGWASKIANIDLLAKEVFKLASFFAKDSQLNLWDLSNNLQFLNILWVYVRSNKYTEGRKWNFKINFNFISKIGWFIKDMF